MDTPGTIALIATALILGCFFAARMIAAVRVPRLPPMSVYGDFPHVPGEMRPARRTYSGGGESGTPERAVTLDVRTHRNGSDTK